uniref:Uncharacterized protein n=1 Tax=Glossina pallidipes TaxID=7398 RepID=A0A1A9ZVX9_GLOPL
MNMKPSKEETTTKAKKSLKSSELKQTLLKELQKNAVASESAKAAPKTFAVTPKELVNTETQTDRDLNDSLRKTIENTDEKLSRKENPEGKSLSSLVQINSLKRENDALKKELKIVREKYKIREMKIQEALRHLRCVSSVKPA